MGRYCWKQYSGKRSEQGRCVGCCDHVLEVLLGSPTVTTPDSPLQELLERSVQTTPPTKLPPAAV